MNTLRADALALAECRDGDGVFRFDTCRHLSASALDRSYHSDCKNSSILVGAQDCLGDKVRCSHRMYQCGYGVMQAAQWSFWATRSVEHV